MKEPGNLLVKVLLTIVLSAAVTAALSPETWKKIIRNFIAGICSGLVFYLIGSSAKLNETWLLIICFVMSAFVSSLWPIVESIARKYLKKKHDDILSNN